VSNGRTNTAHINQRSLSASGWTILSLAGAGDLRRKSRDKVSRDLFGCKYRACDLPKLLVFVAFAN